MAKNEKETDLIVAQMLNAAGIKFHPNGSCIGDIKKSVSELVLKTKIWYNLWR